MAVLSVSKVESVQGAYLLRIDKAGVGLITPLVADAQQSAYLVALDLGHTWGIRRGDNWNPSRAQDSLAGIACGSGYVIAAGTRDLRHGR